MKKRAYITLLSLAGLAASTVQGAGPIQRVPNTTLAMPTNPPALSYTATNAFGNLTFANPVCLASPPGETNRLFVVEKTGRIQVITNLASPNKTLFLDLSSSVMSGGDSAWYSEEGLLGLTFHPGYQTNGYFYVFYTGNDTTGLGTGRHDILQRYQVSSTNANQGNAVSATTLFSQYDQAPNHNAGDLHFGPDGYLYVSLGDEGGEDGQYGNCQRIDLNLFSGIIRIDVDQRPNNLPPTPHPALHGATNYFVPADNPFVGATSFNGLPINTNAVRTEFWAVGLRNPWRFSFDIDGTLWCGDVGQSSREEIDLITKGGNYGWNFWEGFLQRTNNAQLPPGFVPSPPIFDFSRFGTYVAVIGGVVYRGQRFSQLYGAYIYGDSDSGKIFALRYDGTNVTQNTLLMTDDLNNSSDAALAAFGVDPSNGDLIFADEHNGPDGRIRRLVYNTATNGVPLPPTLAATGAFTNLATLAVAPGIVPYDINVPFWSDNAIKTRWISLPDTNTTIGFSPQGNWSFPTGTVWIKHFDLEITNGVPASRVRLETRLLVKNNAGVYGVTYRWGGSTSNATLVAEGGQDETFVLDNGGGILRTQVWHYPSRLECLNCHTIGGGWGLGFNTAQLNKDHDYGSAVTNQLLALSQAGYFSNAISGVHTLRSLVAATNTAVSLEYRVRSYLAANCSQCHQPGGLAHASWNANLYGITAQSGIVNGTLADNLGDTNNRVIVPGALANSVMLKRISTPGTLRMPPIGSNVLDTNAILLLSAWITNDLPAYQAFSDWQYAHFGSTTDPNAASTADPDGDGASNYLEYLTGTDPLLALSFWNIGIQAQGSQPLVTFQQIANRAFELQSTTNPFDSNSWTVLDVPGNEPFFSITNRPAAIIDPRTNSVNALQLYRVRVYEP